MFEEVFQTQIENGLEELRAHKQTCPSNATHLSTVATADFLSNISCHLDEQLLLKKSKLRTWQMRALIYPRRKNFLFVVDG